VDKRPQDRFVEVKTLDMDSTNEILTGEIQSEYQVSTPETGVLGNHQMQDPTG